MRMHHKVSGKNIITNRTIIRAAFCSSWDRKGRVVFDPQYFPYLWWRWKVYGDEEAGRDFIAELDKKQRNFITHLVLDCPDGTVYDADWVDELPNWMNNGHLDDEFVRMCHYILNRGFFGCFYCYAGGQTDAVHIYDGQLKNMLNRVKAEGWAKNLVMNWAWESFGRNPECTAKQNSDAWLLEQSILGYEVVLAGHVGSESPQRFTYASYPVEPDDPSKGDEIGAWYVEGGLDIKIFFGQLEATLNGSVQVPGWQPRMIEGLDRYFATGDPIPIVGQGPFIRDPNEDGHIDMSKHAIGPDWFARTRPVGRIIYCDWEPAIPYAIIHGACTQADIYKHQQEADALGITSQGCLPCV